MAYLFPVYMPSSKIEGGLIKTITQSETLVPLVPLVLTSNQNYFVNIENSHEETLKEEYDRQNGIISCFTTLLTSQWIEE